MTYQTSTRAEKMFGQKHGAVASETGEVPAKKHGVMVKSVDKSGLQSSRNMDTSVWLRYSKVDHEYVATLKCCVCTEFNVMLQGMHNYNPAFVVGSKNLRASSYKEHAATSMHKQAMLLFKKLSSTDVTEYVPIAKALNKLDADAELKVKQKFDNTNLIAKHHLALTKMKSLCELEGRHGSLLGPEGHACTKDGVSYENHKNGLRV